MNGIILVSNNGYENLFKIEQPLEPPHLNKIPTVDTEALAMEKVLLDEMAALSKQQSEALRVAIFIKFSRQQAAEYDTRQTRIGEICKLLSKFGHKR